MRSVFVAVFLSVVILSSGVNAQPPGRAVATTVGDWLRVDTGKQLAYVAGALEMLRKVGFTFLLPNPLCRIVLEKLDPASMSDLVRKEAPTRPMPEAIIEAIKRECPTPP